MLKGSRKVVLFLPPYKGKVLGPPLGLLSLGASLREHGYVPCIIDGALDPSWRKRIATEIEDCLCFGVSLLTGPMIRAASEAARSVKQARPELPIIFGGWHPSLMPGQTLREDFVDIVVRHQGDQTLVEVLRRLEAGQLPDLVPGCWFKREGRVYQNPDRPAIPVASLPLPAYDLADFDAYEQAGGGRKLPYATSIGCPYACNYCTDMVFYNRRFNPIDAARVVGEITDLAARYRLDEVALVDSNFLVDVHRAVAIARGLAEAPVKVRWTFQASTDLLCRMADEEVELLGKSGVTHIGFGTESAAKEVLQVMNKGHQHIPDIREASRKCHRAGIHVTLNLIFGYPGEEESHRRETLRFMSGIAAEFDNVSFSPNVFVPYPGIPIWPQLKTLGIEEPASLLEWADIDLGGNTLPWLRGRNYSELERGISYFLLDNQLGKARRKSNSALLKSLIRVLRRPLHWRLRNYSFRWPVELWISMARQWLVLRRSLLTGQALNG